MAWIWGGETGEQKGRIRLGRVDGFKEVLTILSSAAGPLRGGRDADGDDGGRLGGGSEAVSGLPLAAGRQGPQRPQVPRGAALFHGPLTWRALPAEFGNWNSIWKRFWRLSQAGVFEALFEALAANSQTAHLVQMFDSTTVRAHVSAAG